MNKDLILKALSNVQDPDLKNDIVTLGMVRDLEIMPTGSVSVRIVLTTPACPLKAKIEADVKAALMSVAGVTETKIKMDAEVRRPTLKAPVGQAAHAQSGHIEGVTHIIAVSSGKGGVGKSTVSVNLAVSLAKMGASVGLMDADVYGPNIPTMMGVTEGPKIVNEGTPQEKFVPPSAHGVKVMSMGFLIPADQPLIWRGPMLHSVVNQFCHKVEWGKLDYLVIDMPPGTGDVQLSIAQLVPVTGAVLVTTPQEVSAQDVRKAFAMFEKVRVPALGVVENMSYFECDGCTKKHRLFGEGAGAMLAKRYATEVLAELPLVPAVREGGDFGRPACLTDTSIGASMRALAQRVAQKIEVMGAQNKGGQIEIAPFH